MTTNKKAENAVAESVPVDPNRDLVEFFAFKDSDRYKNDIKVCVNGRVFCIQRGKRVKIPRYVYEVIRHSMAQDAATASMIEREQAAYQAVSPIMG